MIKVKVFQVMAQQDIRWNKDLSEAAGVTPQNLGKIVRGDIKALRFETLEKLCRALKCQPGDLLEYIPNSMQSELPIP